MLCQWQRAKRGYHERAGQQRRKENSNEEKRIRMMEGTERVGENLYVNKIWRVFHKRSFAWQMVFQGLVGMLGLGIPQIIQTGGVYFGLS